MKMHRPPFILKELKLEVTYNCPLVCIHCSSDAAPNISSKIEKDKCLQIIDEAIELGVKEIAFSGGEPLNYNPIELCIEKTSNAGLKSVIYTSGNIDGFEHQISKLAKLGLNKIIFSIYASDEKKHEQITRIKGSYKKTLEAINISKKINIEVELHFVALKQNLKELSFVVELARNLDLKKISVLRFVPQGRGTLLTNQILSQPDFIYLKREINKIRESGFDIRTGSPFNFLLLNNQPECNSAIDRLIINPNLDIFPCDAFKQTTAMELVGTREYSNLNDYNLKECWEKSLFLNKIREYLTTDFAEPCSSCIMLEQCLSGCLAQKALLNGNLRKSKDPNCILD